MLKDFLSEIQKCIWLLIHFPQGYRSKFQYNRGISNFLYFFQTPFSCTWWHHQAFPVFNRTLLAINKVSSLEGLFQSPWESSLQPISSSFRHYRFFRAAGRLQIVWYLFARQCEYSASLSNSAKIRSIFLPWNNGSRVIWDYSWVLGSNTPSSNLNLNNSMPSLISTEKKPDRIVLPIYHQKPTCQFLWYFILVKIMFRPSQIFIDHLQVWNIFFNLNEKFVSLLEVVIEVVHMGFSHRQLVSEWRLPLQLAILIQDIVDLQPFLVQLDHVADVQQVNRIQRHVLFDDGFPEPLGRPFWVEEPPVLDAPIALKGVPLLHPPPLFH